MTLTSLCHLTYFIHKFQGLGCRHLWGAIILPTTASFSFFFFLVFWFQLVISQIMPVKLVDKVHISLHKLKHCQRPKTYLGYWKAHSGLNLFIHFQHGKSGKKQSECILYWQSHKSLFYKCIIMVETLEENNIRNLITMVLKCWA